MVGWQTGCDETDNGQHSTPLSKYLARSNPYRFLLRNPDAVKRQQYILPAGHCQGFFVKFVKFLNLILGGAIPRGVDLGNIKLA